MDGGEGIEARNGAPQENRPSKKVSIPVTMFTKTKSTLFDIAKWGIGSEPRPNATKKDAKL